MPAKACHDFNNDFTLFTAVPVLFNMYTDKDSNLISEVKRCIESICGTNIFLCLLRYIISLSIDTLLGVNT